MNYSAVKDYLFIDSTSFLEKDSIESVESFILANLYTLIYECCLNLDNPMYGIFKECFDWHSCVHGFWAIFRLSFDNNSNEDAIIKSMKINEMMSDIAIEKEFNLLLENPEFEYPYGRAWLLRLSIDYDQWCDHHSIVKKSMFKLMTDHVAIKLLERILNSDTDDDSYMEIEYDNIPWALIQLYDYFQHYNLNDNSIKVKKFVTQNYCLNKLKNNLSFSLDHFSKGFFSMAGVLILCINKTQDEESKQQFLKRNPAFLDDLTPVPGYGVHQLGLNWSRAWGLKSCGLDIVYWNHVKLGWSIHQQIRETKEYAGYSSYYAYDHWVPQFIVYTLKSI